MFRYFSIDRISASHRPDGMLETLNFSSTQRFPSFDDSQSHKVPSGRRYLLTTRRGLTLVEVLVALTASLVLLGAVVSVLGMVSGSISDSRAIIEMSGRLRSAQLLLRSDLQSATCPGLPWQLPDAGNGYIEIFEGGKWDSTTLTTTINGPQVAGDRDDYILFTIRSKDKPFSGLWNGIPIQSNTAEVAWFLTAASGNLTTTTNPLISTDINFGTSHLYVLRRRIFLILPPNPALPNTSTLQGAYSGDNVDYRSDVSFRTNASSAKVLNTLADLTSRKNRCFHSRNTPTSSPSSTLYPNSGGSGFSFNSGRLGEDIVLSNVIGFDIKVFDPTATIDANGLLPGDVGYNPSSGTTRGAYVDMGSLPGAGGFRDAINPKAKLGTRAIYDTWSTTYENDAIDEDGLYGVDQWDNGLDDDGNGIVDDAGERETQPPYPYPLRGIQITIRVWEPSSGTIRQVTVEESFMR